MALREDVLTASFLQMSNFCTETQFHLINCLILEKKLFAKNIKKIPSGPFGPLGIFFMSFANNFFLKVGNLSSETEFRCENLTFGGNRRLADLLSRPFVFLERQNV